jgi:hypothetical protein
MPLPTPRSVGHALGVLLMPALAMTVAACDSRVALPLIVGPSSGTVVAAPPPASGDAAGPADATPPPSPAPAAPAPMLASGDFPLTMPCTNVSPGTTTVYTTEKTGLPPQGEGGVIHDGVYDLTAMTYYDGAGGPDSPDQETIRISGGGTRLEYISSTYKFSIALGLAPANGLLNDTELCPADNSYANMFVGPQYTATPDTFITGNARWWLKVFVRRP